MNDNILSILNMSEGKTLDYILIDSVKIDKYTTDTYILKALEKNIEIYEENDIIGIRVKFINRGPYDIKMEIYVIFKKKKFVEKQNMRILYLNILIFF